MPSQEDYLDQLLKGVIEDTDLSQAASETDLDMGDMDKLLEFAMDGEETESEETGMSEEEIEQILNANRSAGADSPGEVENNDDSEFYGADDLMSLLAGNPEKDSDLQDIHDMLQKDDNNEALDEERIAMMQDDSGIAGENDSTRKTDELSGDSEEGAEAEMTDRQKKALEKKRLREEKAAARKAAKEAKKAERLAKKGRKDKKSPGDESLGHVNKKDVFEALPSDDAAADTEPSETEPFGAEPFMDMSGLPAEEETDEDRTGSDERAGKTEKPKRNLLSIILNFLTEEVEDDDEEERGTEDIPLSDENRQVLEEIDQEKPDKKGKKKKKDKKKNKKANAEIAEDEDEEIEGGRAGAKGRKPKKPKKEKTPREKPSVDSRNRITFKKLIPIVLMGVSLLLIIMLFVNLGSDFIGKNQARKAYYEEDYETCYQELYGRNLNETEQVMFGKSESILRIRLWMREYELFVNEGSEMEALDVLIQAANDYAVLYDYASQWNAADEVSGIYGQMLAILRDKYGLTEAQALEIAAQPDDVEYTRLIAAIVQGDGYTSPTGGTVSGTVELPDMLPEEEQFPENNGGR